MKVSTTAAFLVAVAVYASALPIASNVDKREPQVFTGIIPTGLANPGVVAPAQPVSSQPVIPIPSQPVQPLQPIASQPPTVEQELAAPTTTSAPPVSSIIPGFTAPSSSIIPGFTPPSTSLIPSTPGGIPPGDRAPIFNQPNRTGSPGQQLKQDVLADPTLQLPADKRKFLESVPDTIWDQIALQPPGSFEKALDNLVFNGQTPGALTPLLHSISAGASSL